MGTHLQSLKSNLQKFHRWLLKNEKQRKKKSSVSDPKLPTASSSSVCATSTLPTTIPLSTSRISPAKKPSAESRWYEGQSRQRRVLCLRCHAGRSRCVRQVQRTRHQRSPLESPCQGWYSPENPRPRWSSRHPRSRQGWHEDRKD